MALTTNQALNYYRSDDLIGLGMEADTLRRKLHPEGVVTYILDRKIQYTSLPRRQSSSVGLDRPRSNELCLHPNGGSTLDFDTIYRQIAQTIEMGGTGVVLEGKPDLEITCFERLLQDIRRGFPQISLDCFSAPEILAIAERSGISIRDTLARLRDAGLDSIPGGGAEILGDQARRRAAQQCTMSQQCTMEDWLNVHRTAHQLGMRTTAAMTFGRGETLEQRLQHLDEIRRLQEESGGFAAFYPLNFQPPLNCQPRSVRVPAQSQQENLEHEDATAVEYLKVLAVARLYLDTIENMQCGWAAQGLKVLQLSLRFGGNDVTLGENAAGVAGTANSATEEQLRHLIRGAGFKPVQRDALYATCFLN